MNRAILLFKSRKILLSSVRHSIKERFVGSILGVFWVVLLPILFTAIYSLVYSVYLGGQSNQLLSILSVLCGLIPFLAFAESFGQGVNSVVSGVSLVKNTLFPIELVPLKDVLVGHFSMLSGFLMLIALGLYLDVSASLLGLSLIIFMTQIIMVSGIVYIFSTLNVFIRDVSKSTPIILLLLMLITPIGITLENIPVDYQFILKLNPLTHFVTLYRDLFLNNTFNILLFLKVLSASVCCFFLGLFFLSKLRNIVIDHV